MKVIRVGFALACTLLAGEAFAQQAPPPASPDEAMNQATKLREEGERKEAIRMLKAGMRAFPDHERMRHALSLAYLEDGNDFWALKVLREYEQEHPPACNTRAFQAWIHIKQANFDLAREILDLGGCDTPPYTLARHLLLEAHMAAQQGKDEKAQELLEQAAEVGSYYEEDKDLLDAMATRFDPGHLPVTSWRIDLATGWTSNALVGSPLDPANVAVDTSSALTQVDARLRVVVPTSRSLRPVLEGQLRAVEFVASTVGPLSYRQPSLQAGLLVGETAPTLLLSYGFDAVQIAGGDRYDEGPLWYSEAHRFDYELEANENLLAFGGAGHRWYRETARTRWEAEQGLALGLDPTSELRVMTGASARWHSSNNDAYDVLGLSLLAQLLHRLPADFEARLNLSYSYDDYLHSHGYFPPYNKDEKRADAQVRVKPGLWSPSWGGLRVGLDYDYSRRGSTSAYYAISDSRILLHGVWVMDGDRLGVDLIPVAGREPMPHGVASAGQLSGDELRIRDLMRQDEAVKRGSSCMN